MRKAYRRLALQTHPDRLPQNVSTADKKAAEEQFRLVNNAYEVLNNEENRKVCAHTLYAWCRSANHAMLALRQAWRVAASR